MPNKIDSNIVELRYAEETTIGVLPGSPVWNPLTPNSYGEFGAQYKSVARNPITASRQQQKGVLTDLDVTAGFTHDVVFAGMYDIMQGFFFADWRTKTNLVCTNVTASGYTVASGGTGFPVNSLVYGVGFNNPSNNVMSVVTASTNTLVTTGGRTAETPPAGAKIYEVGWQGAAGDLTITVASGVVSMNSTALDFTTLGLIPGEWIFIGGDATVTQYAQAANRGFCRIKTIAANKLTFDRTSNAMVADTGAAKTIQFFHGHVIKNESNPSLIKRRSYHLERNFGTDPGYEYSKGCVPNTFEFTIQMAEKITVEMGFVGISVEDNVTAKTGTRPSLVNEGAFNASTDFSRLRMLDDSTLTSIATYLTELKLSINNNVEVNKAIGVIGGFDTNAGDFMGSGTAKAYFGSFDAANAISSNKDVSLDFVLLGAANNGWLYDIPLVTLKDGRRSVEKDKPVMLDLALDGAAHPVYDHTMLCQAFFYLPELAK